MGTWLISAVKCNGWDEGTRKRKWGGCWRHKEEKCSKYRPSSLISYRRKKSFIIKVLRPLSVKMDSIPKLSYTIWFGFFLRHTGLHIFEQFPSSILLHLDREIGILFPSGATDFVLLSFLQVGSGARLAPCEMRAGGSFPEGRVEGNLKLTIHLHLISRLWIVKL
jgi:hypothetical protein